MLLSAVRSLGGAWTTNQAWLLYRAAGWHKRKTARDALRDLARRGYLTAHGPEDDRTYTLREGVTW
ncbi:hypothetical protein ACFWGL_16985 [Streptomyces sp. NPDC060286]|uniref:hypothetical protein n=1 Tax=unclassified Streptomyces TaxID=2593676 RepID=UPI0035D54F5C